jgi:hypothetical protein
MRHYDRADFRHLNDGERYRDYDYVADDGWIGPNERAPYGYAHDDAPPWSTLGDWETRPFAGSTDADERPLYYQPQGRDRGFSHGRDDVHPHLRNDKESRHWHARESWAEARPDEQRHAQHDPQRELRGVREPQRRPARAPERHGFFETIRHPRRALERVVTGLFRGTGPKNWARAEERIHDDVCMRLARHPQVDASDIEVKVEDGEVTLSGTVPERRMKRMAEEAIEDVLGVQDVHNRIKAIRR